MAGHKITKKTKDLKYYYDQFMGVKEAQGISDAQNYDYQTQMKIFLNASHNSVDYDTLNQDVLDFFSAIPDTSPARFNKPYNLINCFLNWLVDEEVIKANPIKKNKIKKRVDEGNIHPVQIDDLKKFLKVIPEDEVVGFRNKCIIYVMLDTGMRTCEILRIHHNSLDLKNKRIILTQEDECKVTKDVNSADIGGWGIILEGTTFLLGDSIDAARLHKELKQQYGRLVEPSKENCCGGKQDDLSDVPLKDFAF